MDDQNQTPTTDQDDDVAAQTPATDDSAASVVLTLEGTIKQHQLTIDQLTENLKKHSDMLNDIFANDPLLQKEIEKVKEATKQKNAVKQGILNRPEAADLNGKVKSMRSNLKELKDALSDYLNEYARLSGSNQLEGYDGQIREIVYIARLVRPENRP